MHCCTVFMFFLLHLIYKCFIDAITYMTNKIMLMIKHSSAAMKLLHFNNQGIAKLMRFLDSVIQILVLVNMV